MQKPWEYYLLTNVPGTAHPEVGSIDAVQLLLNQHIDIPAQCWWRDDINRRLDDSWNIKWSYPELLSGPDILRYIIENGLTEDAERRTLAIRTFLRDQFERDREVRFKQVELQNKLLDLFIDVPVNLRQAVTPRRARSHEAAALRAIAIEQQRGSPHSPHGADIGAATLLLHPLAQRYLSRIVIEGAPGQGKSTISQYICQIHRGRILQEWQRDDRIPKAHRNVPIRLPFKIDCRDFSLWLGRQNPFSAEDIAEVPSDWQKSLEAFLAAQIKHYSGGAPFTVSDLHAVIKLSAVLLVFDGLDEVADIGRRREVIDHIAKGANRLHEIAPSVQTIVTSRPAAFANSPGLPEDVFRYFHLASIDRGLIDQYAEKWLKARRLDGKEASDVRRILRDKLDQPHLRELARNPMQLAILLSLVQTRGGSLPDKRTALYDSYVELFFNRESEKSMVVRDHRDLLVDIHRFLAWILHAESQTKQTRGSVSTERLRQLVQSYLINERHDISLADQLFTGMVERVVALVSRVEGTYEFEVQPLREYFAARHLYTTAPYSPPGGECHGTLPERFDALCRDFFWLNVTRFYAGCYSKGELPSLVDRLEELSRTPGYRDTAYPQTLATTLLSDWVFAQHPRSMKQVVALVLNGVGLRFLTSRGGQHRRVEPLVLPKKSGNEELVERCFELLETDLPVDYAWMLAELIRANTSRDSCKERWLHTLPRTTGSNKTVWIQHGLRLGVLSQLDNAQLTSLIADETSDSAKRLRLLLHSGLHTFIESDEQHFNTVADYLLDTTPTVGFRRTPSILEAFIQALNPYMYVMAFENRGPAPLRANWDRISADNSFPDSSIGGSPSFTTAKKCLEVVILAQGLSHRSGADWATTLAPWNALVECGRDHFGERWVFFVLANAAAGIRSKEETCEDAVRLHDKQMPLCRRARYARLRAGVPSWWRSQLDVANGQNELMLTLLMLLTWAGPTVLEKHGNLLDAKLRMLDPDSWLKLSLALRFKTYSFGQEKRETRIDIAAIPTNPSERTIVALSGRLTERVSDQLFQQFLASYEGDDPAVLGFCHQSALRAATRDPSTWEKWLPIISRSYTKGAISDQYFGYLFARTVRGQDLPPEIAEEIVRHCVKYPHELVALSEEVCRHRVTAKVIPVGTVAEAQRWFSD